MQRLELKPKFEEGSRVACSITQRVGTVTRVWCRFDKAGERVIEGRIFYTVIPDTASYNKFKILEENTRAVETDLDGNEIILPKGAEDL